MKTYAYPKLSEGGGDYCWFRIGGPGLANCLFFAAKAYIYAHTVPYTQFVDPTWRKFSIGPWLRKEKDKRIYGNLFYHHGIQGFRKFWILKVSRKSNIVTFSKLGNYFHDINQQHDLIVEMFEKIVRPKSIAKVDTAWLADKIAIHVRLGDYIPQLRISIEWYKQVIYNILNINPTAQFVLFSDGKDDELVELLTIDNLKRVFYGNALADIYAISRCKMVIASDSTFSAWGAFLGQKPIIFSRRGFPSLYSGDILEAVLGEQTTIPDEFRAIILR